MGGHLRTSDSLRRTAALIGAVCIVVGACGGSNGASADTTGGESALDSATTTSTTTTTTIATTTTVTPELVGFPEFTSDSSVSTVGIDAVNFGMTVAAASEAVRGEFVPVDTADGECYLVRPTGGPLGVQLTVTNGTIERVDITTPDITTRSGAGVGMTEDGLASLFGDSIATEVASTGANRVIFTPSDEQDAQFRVIFETDGEVVTSFRSGRMPQVQSTVPCDSSSG